MKLYNLYSYNGQNIKQGLTYEEQMKKLNNDVRHVHNKIVINIH